MEPSPASAPPAAARKGLWPPPPPRSGPPPLISLCILSLDGADLLDRLLASFAATNLHPEVEILVCDHGSGDGTLELLRGWAGRLPVRIIARGANYSFSQSNNRLAQLARGELVLFLNNDVVFTEDVLTDMAALMADAGVAAVGLKQRRGLPGDADSRIYHLGVRLIWNPVERRLRPQHVIPSPRDALIEHAAAQFPAVTASILLCRRAEFLQVGGFSPAYHYGLEDVDLCCRLRWRLGKAIVSLNSAEAVHPKNSTRDRDRTGRRPLEKVNRRVLQRRCGYRLRRELIEQRIGDDGSLTGRPMAVGLVLEAEQALPAGAAALAQTLPLRGWEVRRLTPDDALKALDVIVACTPRFDPGAGAGADPHTITVSWMAEPEAEGFDLRLDDDVAPTAFAERVRACLTAQKLAMKAAGPDASLTALAEGLRRRGLRVRIDLEDAWYADRAVADDVVLIAPDAGRFRPVGDQINLLLGERQGAPPDGVDAVIGIDQEPEELVQAVVAALGPLHDARMAGPQEPRLEDPRAA